MREILFKAKRLDNGKWEAGYYVKKTEWHHIADEYVKTEKHYICVNMVSSEDSYIDMVEVNPDTLCQYTGLTDKNGNKIWENDVVEEDWGKFKGAVHFGLFENQVLKNMGFNIHWFKAISYRQDLPYWADKLEVIGNIFDNPELLGV